MNVLSNSGPLVVFSDVSLSISGNVILDRITLNAEPGTIHCIIGPNGGGKSSLLKSLLGQTRHTGQIAVSWPQGNRTVGYVPQALAFDATIPLTVMDFLSVCVQKRPVVFGPSRSMAKSISKVLIDVKMAGKEKCLVSRLSGGERQRVLFAQALIPSPGLLLLDEPLLSLDESGSQDVSEIIKDISNTGTTVLWVNHDLALVKRIAGAVTCINRRVLFSGTPGSVMTNESITEMFSAYSVHKD